MSGRRGDHNSHLSNRGRSSDVFLANGFDGFISKPIDVRQLNSTLKKFVRDKQPPEIIEAANQQRDDQEKQAADRKAQPEAAPSVDPRLAEIFARDARKAVATLEALNEKCAGATPSGSYGDEDVQLYIINVHGMKSALANIGETELSAVAAKLETAGREKNTRLMSDEIPAFLSELRKTVEKLSPKDAGGETMDEKSEEVRSYLREKLAAVKEACETYDKKAAKAVIAELRQKAWSAPTKELLAEMSEHLLNGDFEEVSSVADRVVEVI